MMKLLEWKKRIEPSENPSLSVPLPPPKKTRDLPNLTECHGCGFKVDVCTGKNRLRTLYSEWRVVLLCRRCYTSVESSQICSYCFSQTSPESFCCVECRHSVHKTCFLNYKHAAPWSYACLGSEFSVCVDCWIPTPLAISRKRIRRRKSEVVENKGRVTVEKGSSRVFLGVRSIVESANRVVDIKVEAAARAREVAMEKAVVAGRAVELANNALNLVPNREESSLNLLPKMDAVKVLDGSELTSELHSRISKSSLLKSSYLGKHKRWASSDDSWCKVSDSNYKHEVCVDDKLLQDTCKSICEPSVSVGSLESDSSTVPSLLGSGSGSGVKTDSKDGERTTEFEVEEIGEELLKEGEGSCSDRLVNFSEDSGVELDRRQADSAVHGSELCNGLPNRYFLKYSRRKCSLKPNLDGRPKI